MKRKYSKAIKQIAQKEGVNEAIVYDRIRKAIEAAYSNDDPETIEYRKKISPDGKVPTPDEFIEILSKEVVDNFNSKLKQ